MHCFSGVQYTLDSRPLWSTPPFSVSCIVFDEIAHTCLCITDGLDKPPRTDTYIQYVM